jgi:hypothetical protein
MTVFLWEYSEEFILVLWSGPVDLKHVFEGKICDWRTRKKMLAATEWAQGKERILETEIAGTRSHSLEHWL